MKSDGHRPGLLTISKPTSGGSRWVEISLTDKSSHCMLVSVAVDLKEFAEAIMGLAYQPCVYEYNKNCPVGKISEHKQETLSIPWNATDEFIDSEIARFEINGWVGSRRDAKNHHHRTRGNKVNISFARYVDPPEGAGDEKNR